MILSRVLWNHKVNNDLRHRKMGNYITSDSVRVWENLNGKVLHIKMPNPFVVYFNFVFYSLHIHPLTPTSTFTADSFACDLLETHWQSRNQAPAEYTDSPAFPMDDELEDKVFYQTYVSHMKILSKFAVGFSSINSPLAYIWKLCRLYVLRPEVIFCGLILFVLLLYLQAVDVWSRSILGRIQATLGRQKAVKMMELSASAGDHQSWEEMKQQSSAFAVLGRRPRMEDRFVWSHNSQG